MRFERADRLPLLGMSHITFVWISTNLEMRIKILSVLSKIGPIEVALITCEYLPVKKAESPFEKTSMVIFLEEADLLTYPSNSRKGSPFTILPTSSPGSPEKW